MRLILSTHFVIKLRNFVRIAWFRLGQHMSISPTTRNNNKISNAIRQVLCSVVIIPITTKHNPKNKKNILIKGASL